MKTQEIMDYAIDNGQAKLDTTWEGAVYIYTHRFSNSFVLNALLHSLKNTHEFYQLFDGVIRAVPSELFIRGFHHGLSPRWCRFQID